MYDGRSHATYLIILFNRTILMTWFNRKSSGENLQLDNDTLQDNLT